MDTTYLVGLLAAVPPRRLLAGAARKLTRSVHDLIAPPWASRWGDTTGDPSVLRETRLFTRAEPAALRAAYQEIGEDRLDAARYLADAASAGRLHVFDRWVEPPCGAQGHDVRYDVLSGRRWVGSALPAGVDPKGVWEPARLSQLPPLAVAARLFPEEASRWLAALGEELSGFARSSADPEAPVWQSPLEVALRGMQLVAARDLLIGGGLSSQSLDRLFAPLLSRHAVALQSRVEDGGLVSGTHALGDLCGLLYLSAAVRHPVGDDRRLWQRFRRETLAQVGADGCDLEGSTGYHRFATELVLAAWSIGRSLAIPDADLPRLAHRMLLAQRDMVVGCFLDPGIGDADDARVLELAVRPARDRAALLALGALLTGDARLKPPGVPACEEMVWLGGPSAVERFARIDGRGIPEPRSFPDGGLHVLRAGGTDVALRVGSVGQGGVGGHAHNDVLSFVVHRRGIGAVIVDAGTYSYCGEPAHRDRFRSAGAHATLTIDGREPNPIPERPFALPDRCRPRVLRFDAPGGQAVAEHFGYRSLPGRPVHRRELRLRTDGRALRVVDTLEGRGEHLLVRHLPLAPGFEVTVPPDGAAALAENAAGQVLRFEARGSGSGLRIEPARGWWSPAYGDRIPIVTLRFVETATLPVVRELEIMLP